MSKQQLSGMDNNRGYRFTPTASLENRVLSSENSVMKPPIKTILRSSQEDSFQSSQKTTPEPTVAKPANQDVPLLGTLLIALTSLGVGAGAVLTAKHFNWFELGQKAQVTVTEKIPKAFTDALGLAQEATQEQTTKKIEELHDTIATLQMTLASRSEDAGLKTELEALQTQLVVATQKLTDEVTAHENTNGKVTQQAANIQNLETRITQQGTEISTLHNTITVQKNDVETAKKELATAQQAVHEKEQALQESLTR